MRRVLILAVICALLSASTAYATRTFGIHGGGPRLGATIDPDQFHFGLHLDLGDLAPRLMLFPNVEIGVGKEKTIVATSFEVDYRFRQDWGSWNPYLGGGIGPVFISGHGWKGDDTELGVTLQGGIARRLIGQSGFFFIEMKLGLADAPDWKFTIGWNFGK